MVDLIKLFPFICMIVTHPLEQISVDYFQTPDSSLFLNESVYIAPDNGFVKGTMINDGLYQIILSLESGNEVVYSGLSEISIQTGERFSKNEALGKDTTITPDTKYILMFYYNSNFFPQFVKNRLTFQTIQSTRVHMIADGLFIVQGYIASNLQTGGIYTQNEGKTVIPQSFISRDAGNYTQVRLTDKDTYISYWHLSMLFKLPDTLKQGDIIGLSGNTGISQSPRLVLNIEDAELSNDIRVIYFRGIMK